MLESRYSRVRKLEIDMENGSEVPVDEKGRRRTKKALLLIGGG
jgi:hypothetical protein